MEVNSGSLENLFKEINELSEVVEFRNKMIESIRVLLLELIDGL